MAIGRFRRELNCLTHPSHHPFPHLNKFRILQESVCLLLYL
jgi:hypothetical protein